mmetsp:Transcript_75429/g.137860  ORF Transcript_75429/g.137860 Transcript_75429/m.137860 type:complete len:128 (-) Transcript_75429:101-484(-)
MDASEEARAKHAANASVQQDAQIKQMQEQQAQQQEMEERKRVMIRTLLEPDANERLGRIELVKPELKQRVEGLILNMANQGAIQEKVSEAQLMQLLEKVGDAVKPQTKVKIIRKRDDSDDDIDLDNL